MTAFQPADNTGPDDTAVTAATRIGARRTSTRLFWLATAVLVLVIGMAQWQSLSRGAEDWQVEVQRQLESALLQRLVTVMDQGFRLHLLPEHLDVVAGELHLWWQHDGQHELAAHRELLQARVSQQLEEGSFAGLRQQLEVLADWHFAPGTSYRLAWELGLDGIGRGDFDAYTADVLQSLLFDAIDFEGLLAADMAMLDQFQLQALQQLSTQLSARGSEALQRYGQELSAGARTQMQDEVVLFDWQALAGELGERAVTEVADQLKSTTAAPLVALVATRLVQSAPLRRLAAGLGQRMLARLPSRAAGGSAAGAATLGALSCGPAAPLCATVAGGAVFALGWWGTDHLIARADQHYNRAQFLASWQQELDRLQQDVTARVVAQYAAQFDDNAARQLGDYQAALQAAAAAAPAAPGQVVPGLRL